MLNLALAFVGGVVVGCILKDKIMEFIKKVF